MSSLRNLRPRAGDSHGEKFWSEGKHEPGGYLFGETPLPPGEKRKWESWEAPWCATSTLYWGAHILSGRLSPAPTYAIMAARVSCEAATVASQASSERVLWVPSSSRL